jgi:hypothetical protein
MPEAVSNNAVASATVDDTTYIYSFAGIDTSRDWFGIHLKGFRYNVQSQVWDTIAPLPDPNGGKIAAGASNVKGKIYIIGGYHVASNYSEISSAKVHIYDPTTNSYLPDGADIPVAIDDQVQAVWRDSLIYVITGWSNSNNVNNVQIYNPSTDTWTTGTPVPNNSQYKVFGGSGTIVGDSIYYIGGARFGFNFPATTILRKGYINPDNPAEITWEQESNPVAKGYRMAATQYNEQPIWIGGSDVTYNFDGIAYNGSGSVAPLGRIKMYDPSKGILAEFADLFPPLMDLRGVAELGENQYLLAGGMLAGPSVTNQTLLLTIDQLSDTDATITPADNFTITPNPADQYFRLPPDTQADEVQLYNAQGALILRHSIGDASVVPIDHIPSGQYFVVFYTQHQAIATQPMIVQH